MPCNHTVKKSHVIGGFDLHHYCMASLRGIMAWHHCMESYMIVITILKVLKVLKVLQVLYSTYLTPTYSQDMP